VSRSTIEWTHSTWNPVTGCTKVSPGCLHCYAERMTRRLHAMGQPNYSRGFRVAVHERMLELPLGWSKPQMIFVNSMSDIFHENVPEEFIRRVFAVMAEASWHTFQLLTKRAERLVELGRILSWPPNVWAGVSVESREHSHRVKALRRIPAAVRFVSFEPLLGPLGRVDIRGIDWVIVGGESGPGARWMEPDWVTSLRDQCLGTGVPFFFKQWGGTNRKRTGRLLDGRTWDQLPRPGSRSSTRTGP